MTEKYIVSNLIKISFDFYFLNRMKGTRNRYRECVREFGVASGGEFETYGEKCDSEEAKGTVLK